MIFARMRRFGRHPTLENLRQVIIEVFDEIRNIDGLAKRVCRSVVTRMEEVIEQQGRQIVHRQTEDSQDRHNNWLFDFC